jgi:hypothetical protein
LFIRADADLFSVFFSLRDDGLESSSISTSDFFDPESTGRSSSSSGLRDRWLRPRFRFGSNS